MVRVGDGDPLVLFRQGIRAEKTLERYTSTLRQIVCEFFEEMLEGTFEERVAQLVKYGRDDPKWTRDLMFNMSRMMRARSRLPKDHRDYLNPSSFRNYFSPVKKLLDMNDVSLPWKRIYATYPEMDNMPDTAGWTRDDIARMLVYARDPMERALVLVLASSGMRVGALDSLNWGDVTPVYRAGNGLTLDPGGGSEVACAALEVYRGSSENYTTFMTPEAFEALQEYGRVWSEARGRQAAKGDPVFVRMKGAPQRITRGAIQRRMCKMGRRSGVYGGDRNGRRYGVPMMNGFRRFFNKTTKDAPTPDTPGALIRSEYMMGHRGLTALDRNYYKTNMLELAAAYVLAVPDLTIDDADRLRLSNRRMADNIQKMEGEKDEKMARMEKELARLKDEAARLKDEKDEKMARMEKEIVELRKGRVPPGMDLAEALRGAAGADGVPKNFVESLTGMVSQLKESQETAIREMRERQEAANKEMQAKHDAEMRELRRALDVERTGSLT